MAHTDYGTDTRMCRGVGEWLTRIMARIHGCVGEWGSGEWLTRIVARIHGCVGEWGNGEMSAPLFVYCYGFGIFYKSFILAI
ncbi:MAG: hypothetical protein SWX82_09630 [Cyanobacteriota bacterium]|nr:hypothetical protein [Cyanobacteriota bacterium]